jgi:hypothetical protein
MLDIKPAAILFAAVFGAAAQAPLPELRTEATPGGSVFSVRNAAPQPLTGYLIELVNYPGSYYMLWQDEITGEAIPGGGEKRIPVTNMIVGAAPDYVKIQAALYADGTVAGVPDRVAQFVERRRFALKTIRELMGRLERAKAEGTANAVVAASLRQWIESMPQIPRSKRNSQEATNQSAAAELVSKTAISLGSQSLDEVRSALRDAERKLASSKPTL